MEKKHIKPIQSIDRAIDTLLLFTKIDGTLGISELAAMLELPKTTVQGIVNTLVARDMLEKCGLSAKYQLGPALFQLGMRYTGINNIISFSDAFMQRLSFKYSASVNVSMAIGSGISIVMHYDTGKKHYAYPSSGSFLPAHASSTGKTLLAYMPDKKREALLGTGTELEAYTHNTITSREKLSIELDAIREKMIGHDREELIIGIAGISGPVFNASGAVIAAFSVFGNAQTIYSQEKDIEADIRYTTMHLSSKFGCENPQGDIPPI
jgi:DNA-binding IclR family transcriptional regulator